MHQPRFRLPDSRPLSWAALLIAGLALAVALSGAAIGLSGKGTVDKNDLRRGVVRAKNIKPDAVKAKHVRSGAIGAKHIAAGAVGSGQIADGGVDTADLSAGAQISLTEPRAYAFVTGDEPGGGLDIDVDESRSVGVTDDNLSANNSAFCINDVGFEPRHVQVTASSLPDGGVPKAILDETAACNGNTAIFFEGGLDYDEDFFVALFD